MAPKRSAYEAMRRATPVFRRT